MSHQQAQDVVNDTVPGLSSIGEQRHNLEEHRASATFGEGWPPSVSIIRQLTSLRKQVTDGTIKLTEHHTGNGRWRPLMSGLIRPFRAKQQETDAVIAFLERKPDPNFLIDLTFVKTWPENRPALGIQR